MNTRFLLGPLLAIGACTLQDAQEQPAPRAAIIVNGADRTGKADSRAALQRAIDTVAGRGGGTVYLPKGTYLLDTYRPSTHPWKFYNLRVPSNVTVEAEPGTILLQGPGGRAPLPAKADRVENNVIAVGTANYQAVTFQDPARNGGFRPANPTAAGNSTLTLSNPADASGFSAGDLIVVYAATSGDAIESEPTEVRSVDRASGVLLLAHPLARSFGHAFVAKVTTLATTHVSLRNLTIQGAIPLAATEVFDLSLYGCRLLYDNAAGGSNLVTGMTVNTIRGFHMENGSIEPAEGSFAGLELPQRNSQDVLIENVAFKVASAGFGEYGAHWKLIHNQFWIQPARTTTAGIAIGGLDVDFEQNTIHGENLTAGGGSGALLTDATGPPDYLEYIGHAVYRGNTIECRADGNNCLRLTTRDPIVDHNQIAASGNAIAIKVEGAAANFELTNNTISCGAVPGLVLSVRDWSSGVVKGNLIKGTGPYAILLGMGSPAAAGKRLAAENVVSGFAAAVRNVTP